MSTDLKAEAAKPPDWLEEKSYVIAAATGARSAITHRTTLLAAAVATFDERTAEAMSQLELRAACGEFLAEVDAIEADHRRYLGCVHLAHSEDALVASLVVTQRRHDEQLREGG